MSGRARSRSAADRRPALRVAVAAVLLLVGLPACGGGVHGEAAVKKAAYDNSKKACSPSTAPQIAKNFKANPNDPRSVAAAYARNFYKPRYQADSRAGCLAGLRGK